MIILIKFINLLILIKVNIYVGTTAAMVVRAAAVTYIRKVRKLFKFKVSGAEYGVGGAKYRVNKTWYGVSKARYSIAKIGEEGISYKFKK